jgi:hypothetical protein
MGRGCGRGPRPHPPARSLPLDGAGELLLDPAEAPLERGGVDLADHHVASRLRRQLRDRMAHEAAAKNSDLLDLH